MNLDAAGRLLLVVGLVIAGLGLLLVLGGRLPFLGQLPGDVSLRWGSGSLYFPIVTCLVLSVVVTVGVNILLHVLHRP